MTPITYVDRDPHIPTHLGTDAPHVHHRESDRCLRVPDGEHCPTLAELRAEVERLRVEAAETTLSRAELGDEVQKLRERVLRIPDRLQSAESERDALQQRLDRVRELLDDGPWYTLDFHGDTLVLACDDIRAALASNSDAPTTCTHAAECSSCGHVSTPSGCHNPAEAERDALQQRLANMQARHVVRLATEMERVESAVAERDALRARFRLCEGCDSTKARCEEYIEAGAIKCCPDCKHVAALGGPAAPSQEPQPIETSDIRSRLNALADEWERTSGLASPLANADITSASPAQRTLWEAASELREALATWPSDEDEARAWRLRAWASSRVAEAPRPEPQPTDEETRSCCEHCQPDTGEETHYCDRTHRGPCAACAAPPQGPQPTPEAVKLCLSRHGDWFQHVAGRQPCVACRHDAARQPTPEAVKRPSPSCDDDRCAGKPPCLSCVDEDAARQSEPVERITDANGDETERGADTDTPTHQQDGDHR